MNVGHEVVITGTMIDKRRLFPGLIILTVMSVLSVFSSCLKEEGTEPKVDAENGIYIKGKATAYDHFDAGGLMKPAVNAATGNPRSGLYEIFVAVSSEASGFNLVEVINGEQTVYGPLTEEKVSFDGSNGTITGSVTRGIAGEDGGVFRVNESGLYHIVVDRQTDSYVISPLTGLSVNIKQPESPEEDLEVPLYQGFDKTNMVFIDDNIRLGTEEFRIRYGHGDRLEVTPGGIYVSTYFGGEVAVTENGYSLEMKPGGDAYTLPGNHGDLFSVMVSWTVSGGFTCSIFLDDGDYPETMFIAGTGISTLEGEDAWNWELNDFEMVPVHSSPHLFWKIVWLKGDGAIRFAPDSGGTGHFGVEGVAVDDIYETGSGDLPVPAMAGYYMLVVNLRSGQVSVTRPQVYLIGDAVGSWNARNQDFRFNVDNSNKLISLLKLLEGGSVRMYAWQDKGWFTQWWHSEFNVYNGRIVYRGNGLNLEPVGVIPGFHTIELDFINGEASIELCGCS